MAAVAAAHMSSASLLCFPLYSLLCLGNFEFLSFLFFVRGLTVAFLVCVVVVCV